MNWTFLYVGALYAIAVAIARRAGVDLPKRVAVFFYALVLVFFFRPLTGDFVITQDDILETLPPWHYVAEDTKAINPEMNDIPLQHTVWGHQVRESWKSLTVPLWNEYNGSGYPLLANGQSSALSPIRLLAIPVPAPYAMTAEAAIKILIALTFTYLFLRGRGLSMLAATIGAATFGFAGFLHSWLHFPHVTTAVFLPAVLYFIDRLALQFIPRADAGSPVPPAEPEPRASIPHRRSRVFARDKLLAALVWTFILFGGHPETASHIFFLALLYVVWIVFVERRTSWRLFLTLGGAMTVAALLSAPFLLPFLEALPRSQRYQALRAVPYDAKELPYTDLQCMIVAFQAHFYGQVPQEERWGPAVAEPVGGFAGILGITSFFAMLVHVIRRRAWRSAEMFFLLATVLVFGVIDGWPLLGEAIHAVLPVVAHARFRLLLVMLMAIHAASAVDLTLKGERAPILIGAGITGAMLVALFATTDFPDAARRMSSMTASMRSVAVLVFAVLLALLARWRKPVYLLLLVAVVTELFSVTRGWNPVLPREMFFPQTPVVRAVMALTDRHPANDPFRIAGAGAMLFPNTNAMYGVEDMRAHDPMSNDRYMGLLKMTADYSTTAYHAMFHHVGASVVDYVNVRYLLQDLLSPVPDPARYKLIYEGVDGRIFENRTALPRFFAVRNVLMEFRGEQFAAMLAKHNDWANTAILNELDVASERMRHDFFDPRPESAPRAKTAIVEARPTSYRIRVDAPRWSLVVSSIPWWPGWRVSAPARPVRVNGVFLGFAIPPGSHDVRVSYRPWTWWVGVALAGLTVIGIVWTGVRGRRYRRASASA